MVRPVGSFHEVAPVVRPVGSFLEVAPVVRPVGSFHEVAPVVRPVGSFLECCTFDGSDSVHYLKLFQTNCGQFYCPTRFCCLAQTVPTRRLHHGIHEDTVYD